MSEIVKFGSLVFGAAILVGVGIWYNRSNLPTWLKALISVAIIVTGAIVQNSTKQFLSGPMP